MEVLGALLPSIGVGLLFWYVMRLVFQADRREREAIAEIERAHRDREATSAQNRVPSDTESSGGDGKH